MSELQNFLGTKMKWKEKYTIDWCDLCDTAIIICPVEGCLGTSCNAMGCSNCTDDFKEFNEQKTKVEEYLTKEEIEVYYKSRELKRFLLESLSVGEPEINWDRLFEEGKLSINNCKLFEKELKGKTYLC